jgi:hypothetical protein
MENEVKPVKVSTFMIKIAVAIFTVTFCLLIINLTEQSNNYYVLSQELRSIIKNWNESQFKNLVFAVTTGLSEWTSSNITVEGINVTNQQLWDYCLSKKNVRLMILF